MSGLKHDLVTVTIGELKRRQTAGCLNLNPGFQRRSVWNPRDRCKLIKSVLDGDPIPAIFLYKSFERGRWLYHVLDGKQRLESVFMFLGVRPFHRRRDRMELEKLEYQFENDDQEYTTSWQDVPKKQKSEFLGYKVPVVEVEGELGPITKLFVRINSLGKPLSGQEKRHAFGQHSPLLGCAQHLAERYRPILKRMGVVTNADQARMQDIELCAETVLALQCGGPQHKKRALDRAVQAPAGDKRLLDQAAQRFGAALRLMQRLFPNSRRSLRYYKRGDWYSLMLVLDSLAHDHNAIFSQSTCAQGAAVLKRFARKVDELAQRHKDYRGPGKANKAAQAYFISVQAGTDALSNRMTRAKILKSLLSGIFETRDVRRRFSPEQRRLIFNSTRHPVCRVCHKPLDWTNFHADHVLAHSRGGRTILENAQPLCAKHNLKKGARRR